MNYNLSTGKTVELEIYNEAADERLLAKTLIEKSDGDQFLLVHAPILSGKIVLLQLNEEVRVSFSQYNESRTDHEVFSFLAKVESRQVYEEIAMVGLRRIGEIAKVQRRDYFRLNYIKQMAVTRVSDNRQIDVLSKDISLGGMRFISQVRFARNDKIICRVNFEDRETVLVEGVVLACGVFEDAVNQYVVRVEFVGIDREKSQQIVKNINSIQATYLKKLSSEYHNKQLDATMPPLNAEKLEQYQDDVKFDISFGYIKGIIWLAAIIALTLFLFARPSSAYMISKMLGTPYSFSWNYLFLRAALTASCGAFLCSLLGLYFTYRHYRSRKSIDRGFIFSAGFSAIIMTIAIVAMLTQITRVG